MADLDEYLRGPVDGGPTRSGHRTPALPNIEEILAVPGIGFAEMGPGDLSLSLGYRKTPQPWPELMQGTHERVKAACAKNGVAFLHSCMPETVVGRIDAGARVIAGGHQETAVVGREHTRRQMPV